MKLFQIQISADVDLIGDFENGKVGLKIEGAPKPALEWIKAKIPGKIDDAIIDLIEKWLDGQNQIPPAI